MFLLILIITAAVVWCILATEGIKRGRRGEVVIFRSWANVALTFALVVPMLRLIVAPPWLWMTARANPRMRDLWVVVPAKISLTILAVACSVLVILLRDRGPFAQDRNAPSFGKRCPVARCCEDRIMQLANDPRSRCKVIDLTLTLSEPSTAITPS
jgi:hypothetical protein